MFLRQSSPFGLRSGLFDFATLLASGSRVYLDTFSYISLISQHGHFRSLPVSQRHRHNAVVSWFTPSFTLYQDSRFARATHLAHRTPHPFSGSWTAFAFSPHALPDGFWTGLHFTCWFSLSAPLRVHVSRRAAAQFCRITLFYLAAPRHCCAYCVGSGLTGRFLLDKFSPKCISRSAQLVCAYSRILAWFTRFGLIYHHCWTRP